ncbi:hypothetical protein LTR28_007455, partial [Elasticomyces elasticus]
TYRWGLTRDCQTASVELSRRNSFRATAGVAYNKAYDLHKNLFATPIKRYTPFDNLQYQGLAYSTALIEDMYYKNFKFSRKEMPNKRPSLKKTYRHTKRRLRGALGASTGTDFGIRQEHRISYDTFRVFEPSGEIVEGPTAASQRPRLTAVNLDLRTPGHAAEEGSLVGEDHASVPTDSVHDAFGIVATKEADTFLAAELLR